MGKGLFVVMMVIGASFFVIYRKVRAAAGKLSVFMLVSKLKRGEVTNAAVAETLDIPYHTISGASATVFRSIVEKMKADVFVGGYRILYSSLVHSDQLLVLTELSFNDFDIKLSGKAGDVKSKAFHNFLLKFDPAKSSITVYSNLYENATDKFQKQEFLNVI